ncbi:unnamed protein product [Paramecium primaurelia]|uniref:Trichohyalin-plectin-homology domain-containing protein n=1 Tax=Paramecium primaurelia TaxID=5886 RepID=A0A8S1MG25_PARPR|nr:unnamed protein product [Paramecium primaurelia]
MSKYQTEFSDIKSKSLLLPQIKQPHTIITAAELEQIKSHITFTEQKAKKSYDSQKVWAQRIEKQRQQKEKEKFQKFILEEEERRKIDREEADYQEKLKINQIGDANNKIFGQRADVRNMKSKMLWSEIDKANQKLIQLNKEKQEMQLMYEAQKTREIETQKYISEQVELEKSQLKEQLKKQTYDSLAKQHHEVKERYLKEYIQLKKEGDIIKKQAEEEELKKEKQKEDDKIKKQKLLAEHQQLLQIKQKIQQDEQKLDENQSKERDQYQQQKDRVLEMRKEREIEKKQRQLKIRQQIYDIRVTQLKKQEDDYMQRVQKHAEELQKHDEEVAKQKELEKSQMIQEGEQFRLQQLKLKEKQKEKEQQELQQEHKLKISALEQLSTVEDQQKEILKRRNKEVQEYQKMQIELKKQMRRNQFLNELKESKQMELRSQIEKDAFNNWAQSQITELKESGLNLYPLTKSFKV